MVKYNQQLEKGKVLKRVLLAILPGLIVTGLVFSANFYYDLDITTVKLLENKEISVSSSATALTVTQSGAGYAATFMGGNVGIGTTGPEYKLDVAGTGRFTNNLWVQDVPLVSESFEGSFPPSGWTTDASSGSQSWQATTTAYYNGSYSAANGTVLDNGTSTLDRDYTFSNAGELRFFWKVSSEATFDYLLFCLDNDSCTRTSGYLARISGTVDWEEVVVPVSAGAHSFRWVYAKDGNTKSGSDTGWLDYVRIYEVQNLGILAVDNKIGIGTTTPSEKLTISGGNIRHYASGNPTLLGNYDTTGEARDVYVLGKYAYVADRESGLQIIDISNPSSPVLVGTYDTPGMARGVFVAGKYAYVADGTSGMEILDVSNPTSPSLVGSVAPGGDAYRVKVSGKYAYFITDTAIRVIDVSDPASPVEVKSLSPGGTYFSAEVAGSYLYVANCAYGTRIYDITDPLNPVLKSTFYPSDTQCHEDVCVSGKYAYVADEDKGLRIADISSSTNPSQVGIYDTYFAFGVFASGDYVYLADHNNGFAVIDVSSPTSPSLVGTYDTSGQARKVFVSGKYAYVADVSSGLQIIDISGVKTPTITAGNISADFLSIGRDVNVNNSLYIRNSLNIGSGGVLSDGTLAFSGAGNNYFAGNLGIGTTTPSYKLHVWGTSGFGSATSSTTTFTGYIGSNFIPYTDLTYNLGSSLYRWANIYTGTTTISNSLSLSYLTQGSVLFAGSGGAISQDNANFFWDNSQKRLGIGTTTPSSLLEIYSTDNTKLTITAASSTDPQIAFRTGATPEIQALIGIDYSDSNKLKLVRGSDIATSTGLTIDSSGNVGIGTTTPNNLLQVKDLISFKDADWKTLIGYQAGRYDIAQYNTYLGYQAGYGSTSSNNTADYNTAVGYRALYSNTTGYENAALGSYALYSNTTGNYNTALGPFALRFNTTGNNNTALGYYVLYFNTTGNNNTALGYNVLYYPNATNTVAIGYEAGFGGSGSNFQNAVLVGYQAGRGLTTGSNNILMGYSAGSNLTTGANNIIIGYNLSAPATTTSNFLNIGNTIYGDLSSGNVGIGTTTPSSLLEIYSTDNTKLTITAASSTDPQIAFRTGATPEIQALIGIDYSDSNKLKLVRGSDIATSTGLTIDSSGNVGIGTTSPSVALELGADRSLRITGGTSFPGSPSEGQMFFRTDTYQLYTYANSKWQADRTTATKIVAASDSQNKEKADYVCDGTNDEANIESAISDLPSTGGVVYLLDGTYSIGVSIDITKSNVSLIGAGKSTILKLANSANTRVLVVGDGGTTAVEGILISQIQVDGNKANNATGTYGIYFNNKITKSRIEKIWVHDCMSNGIRLYASSSANANSYNAITQSDVIVNSATGISLSQYSNNNLVSNNNSSLNTGSSGINVSGSYNVISNNIVKDNGDDGIILNNTANYNTVSGNTISSNGAYDLRIGVDGTGHYNTITGNIIVSDTQEAIFVDSGHNTITGNFISQSTDSTDGIRIRGLGTNDNNVISSNRIIRSANSGGYAIDVYTGGQDNTLIIGNEITGAWTAKIDDAGTGTTIQQRDQFEIESARTSGTLLSLGIPSATTLVGALTGANINLSSNLTATGRSVTGQSISLPAVTNTGTSTYNYKALTVSGGALVQNTGAGIDNWTGLDVTMPNITQTTGTITSTGLKITGGTVTSGTSYGLIVDSNAGNVGIGTTSPAYLLDVWGTSRFGSATSTQVVFGGYVQSNIIPYSDITYNLGSSNYRWANLYAATTTIGGTIVIGTNTFEGSATTTLFTTGNSNQLVLAANGNVGIGTTTLGYKLDVNGDINIPTGSQYKINGVDQAFDKWSAGAGNDIYRLNGNVAIGTTTPSSLLELYSSTADTKLTVTAATSTDPQVVFRTGATPAIQALIGIDYSDSNKLKLVRGSDIATSTGLTIDSSGNVGIGTTSPGVNQRLDVAGGVAISGGTGQSYAYRLQDTGGLSRHMFYIDSNNYLSMGNSNIAGVYISSNDVGIGTTSPQSTLHLQGALPRLLFFDSDAAISTSNPAWSIRSTASDGSFQIQSTANYSSYSERLAITTSGNVGIGTTTPAYLLDVWGTSGFGSATSSTTTFTGYIGSNFIPYTDSAYTLGASGYRWANLYAATTTIGGTIVIGTNTFEGSATTTLFTTGNANQLVLGANGNIGIGTASPAYKLDISGSGRFSNNLTVGGNLTVSGTGASTIAGTLDVAGNVAFGSGASVGTNITIEAARTTTSPDIDQMGIDGFLIVNPSATGTVTYRGLQYYVDVQSGNTRNITGKLFGSYSGALHHGSGTVSTAYGAYDITKNYSAGTITTAVGAYGLVDNNGTGNITYSYGLLGQVMNTNTGTTTYAFGAYVPNPYVSAGSITNNYGLYVENQTAASNNYAIYVEGGRSVFGGDVGIGTTTPASLLEVYSSTTNSQLTVTAATSTDAILAFRTGATPSIQSLVGIDYSDSNKLKLVRGSDIATSTGLTIDSSGNVGIGTTTPNNLLSVYQLIDFNNTDYNTKLGYQAGLNIVSGAQYNTFIGYQAGYASSTASTDAAVFNTAIGYKALFSNTTGYANSAIGSNALMSNTTGYDNSAMGFEALKFNTGGIRNTAIGSNALKTNTTGSRNLAMGYYALVSNTTGDYNVALGNTVLNFNTTGSYNAALGYAALYYNTSATSTVAIGSEAAKGTASYSNQYITVVGTQAGYSLQTGSNNNTFLGYQTGYNVTTGANNLLLGFKAGDNLNTGSNNLIIGYDIDAPSATANYQLSIGNLIFGTNLNATGTAISSGNIGIGTTTPTSLLEVYSSTANSQLTVTAATSTDAILAFRTGATPSIQSLVGIDYSDSNKLKLVRGSDIATSTGLTIDSSGNVGIGTTTPAALLNIFGTSEQLRLSYNNTYYTSLTTNSSGYLDIRPWAGLARIYASTTSYYLQLGHNGSDAIISNSGGELQLGTSGDLIIDSGVKVGIATSTPTYVLDVWGTSRFGSATSSTTTFTGYIGSNFIPYTDNQYTLGASGYRWSNLYAATTTVGDIVFGNEFRIIEADASSTFQALIFKNQRSEEIMKLDENGNLAINGELITGASSITSTMPETESLGIIGQIKEALASLGLLIENGIARVRELFAEKIFAKNVCLEGDDGETICVNKDQLKELLSKNQIQIDSGGGLGGGDSGGGSSNGNSDNGGSGDQESGGETTLVCDTEHLESCDTQEKCQNANLYWYDDACHKEPKEETPEETIIRLPDWQCSDWQPLTDEVCSGETFNQIRTCADLNNCGVSDGKPAEIQETSGTKDCPTPDD